MRRACLCLSVLLYDGHRTRSHVRLRIPSPDDSFRIPSPSDYSSGRTRGNSAATKGRRSVSGPDEV
jgi:hypothetical protein